MMKNTVIVSFYKFVPLTELELLRVSLLEAMHTNKIKGTLILALEGINGGFAGTRENVDLFYQFLRSDAGFMDLNCKETFDEKIPFDKAKVKIRKEIVSLGLPKVNPLKWSDTHLSPEQWHEFIQDPEVLLLDARNEYEYHLGTFKNAIHPNTDSFRDFPRFVEEHLMEKKDKKIAMFCTGGIRCEKTVAFMKDLGFKEVYQLQDGILNYIKTIPASDSLWEGQCFVFDDRVAVDKELNRVYPQLPEDYKDERFSK